MFKIISLYTIFIMKFLLTKQIPCGRYEVANCTSCDPDPEKERCIECKSGMFPFVAGTEC